LEQDLHESGVWAIQRIFPELRESEDERIRKNLIRMVQNVRNDSTEKGYYDISFDKYLSYLEKQKEQKPAEWSEEDETHVEFILESLEDQIRFCKKDAEGAYYAKQIRTAQNWLKSLRPVSKESLQPHWKPSEEQMEAFKGYIEDFQAKAEAAVGGWNNFDVMIRLYEQLKAIKEEWI